MKVRLATLEDLPWLLEQGKKFADTMGPGFYNEEYLPKFGQVMITQNIILVAADGDQIFGMLGAAKVPNIFNPDRISLLEVFWWVAEESRGGKAAALLLKEFVKLKDRLGADDLILSLEADSPIKESSLEKRGFRLREKAYVMGG